jgi:hypothetical protein
MYQQGTVAFAFCLGVTISGILTAGTIFLNPEIIGKIDAPSDPYALAAITELNPKHFEWARARVIANQNGNSLAYDALEKTRPFELQEELIAQKKN